jgi:hypothetical protein
MGGVDVYICVFLSSALFGGEWSVAVPGHFTPMKKSYRYPLGRGLGGSQNRSGRERKKSCPYQDPISDPSAVQPHIFIYLFTCIYLFIHSFTHSFIHLWVSSRRWQYSDYIAAVMLRDELERPWKDTVRPNPDIITERD